MFASSLTRLAVLGLILSAGVATAKGERSVPEAAARAEIMQTIAKNTKVLGEMAGGKAEFDAAAAQAAKEALVGAAVAMPEAYATEGAADPASESAPAVWSNWDEFTTKVKGLETAALALDPTSIEGVKAGMAGVSGTCRDCHTSFRK